MPVKNIYFKQSIPSIQNPYFFNSLQFLSLFPEREFYTFNLLEIDNQLAGTIHFYVEDDKAISLPMAPFGSLETSCENIYIIQSFFKEIEITLFEIGVRKMIIKHWPEIYNSPARPLSESLLNAGFQREFQEASFYYKIENTPVTEKFKKTEITRLAKTIGEEFVFSKIIDPNPSLLYELLREFKIQKKTPLNISESDFCNALKQFPDRYLCFDVTHKERIVSIAVCVKINDKILYHFLLGSDIRYASKSPALLVYEGLYNFALENDFKILDLGIASIEGQKQKGLFEFKSRIGGMHCGKPVFSKIL